MSSAVPWKRRIVAKVDALKFWPDLNLSGRIVLRNHAHVEYFPIRDQLCRVIERNCDNELEGD
jgi:hypothetical protein